jgi:hypothetical protein
VGSRVRGDEMLIGIYGGLGWKRGKREGMRRAGE